MKIFACFVLLTIFISYADEQETAIEQNNARVSVYLHPISLSSNVFAAIINAIYSTVEIPFSLSNSLIVKPSFLRENTDIRMFKLGSDIGMRHYLFGKGEGLYLQGQIGVFYYRCDDVSETDTFFAILPLHPGIRPLWLDAMGYLGYSLKFSNMSIFADMGFGVVSGKNNIDRQLGLYLLPDFNVGIGIPFGAAKPINAPASAQEEWKPKQDNTRISVYLHPFFFLLGILEEANPLLAIYSTIEIPFNLERSLIVKPSFLREERNEFTGRQRNLRAGGDIGMRAYHSKKGEGFYWQMQTGVFYHDAHLLFPEISAYNSIWFDIMGYLGYSKKFPHISVFADVGSGLMSLFGLECDGRCIGFFPVIDANFGIGLPF